ncbi:MAG: AAA family ATPase [Pseudomonadales bacterium]
MLDTNITLTSVEQVEQELQSQGYVADRALATSIYLSLVLEKPIFLEGEPGVGKTEVAKSIARALDTRLIRLQCYEGLDTNHALYEWDYLRQMLEIRLQEARGKDQEHIGEDIFSEKFLHHRPLLQAIQDDGENPPVLLIDEVDRSDEEFEAFLLEVLSDFQITIPEIGPIKAKRRPIVVLTSNRTRELHNALKRRCLYHWIDYPTPDKEMRIVLNKVAGIDERLSAQICGFMAQMREQDFYKPPGVAETIDWAHALLTLGIAELDEQCVDATLGCILKYKGDQEKLREENLRKMVAISKNFKGSALSGKDFAFPS